MVLHSPASAASAGLGEVRVAWCIPSTGLQTTPAQSWPLWAGYLDFSSRGVGGDDARHPRPPVGTNHRQARSARPGRTGCGHRPGPLRGAPHHVVPPKCNGRASSTIRWAGRHLSSSTRCGNPGASAPQVTDTRGPAWKDACVPNLRTMVTELGTGLGMLGGDDLDEVLASRPAVMRSLSPEDWDLLHSVKAGGAYDAEFHAAWLN